MARNSRAGRNRLFHINTKYFKIAGAVLVAVAAIAAVSWFVSQGRISSEKQNAVKAVASRGYINVGLRGDLGQLCLYDEATGTYSGLEKDIADEIIKRLFPDGIIVNYININSETKDALLQTGDVDISLGASVNKNVSGINYSSSYFTDPSAFLVREGEMTTVQGLSGNTVAVVKGSLAETTPSKKKMNLAAYFDSQGINASIRVYASYPEAIEALRAGYVKGVCANELFLKLFGKSGMLLLNEKCIPSDYCVQIRKEKLGAFSDSVGDVIKEMKSDGMLAGLLDKWQLVSYVEPAK